MIFYIPEIDMIVFFNLDSFQWDSKLGVKAQANVQTEINGKTIELRNEEFWDYAMYFIGGF